MLEKNRRVLWHLSLIPGVGPATTIKLLKGLVYKKTPHLLHVELLDFISKQDNFDLSELYKYSTSDLIRLAELPELTASVIQKGLSNKSLIEKEEKLATQYNIQVTSLIDSNYPEILMQIQNPPVILYSYGREFCTMAKRIAIVGSRKADLYAKEVIKNLVPTLVANGWHIVSGGAEGADTMAHECTLDAKGCTIAVLGSGLLCPYPASNKDLFKAIANNNGLVISSFPLTTMPDRGNFPARNRIISGLSLGCIVVRAAEKSGALITAHMSLEQGRSVFAVPGKVSDELSKGCHDLLKQGAKLVESASDILEEFGETNMNIIPTVSPTIIKTASVKAEQEPTDPVLEKLVKSATTDELSIQTGMNLTDLQNHLFELQLDGKVKQNFAGSWERII